MILQQESERRKALVRSFGWVALRGLVAMGAGMPVPIMLWLAIEEKQSGLLGFVFLAFLALATLGWKGFEELKDLPKVIGAFSLAGVLSYCLIWLLVAAGAGSP